ncbi:MAG: DUF2220 family protein [Candidatus Electryonea clarkiae]|nr:DUF2220 family protein [Candidatus Electryonea clarkiae]
MCKPSYIQDQLLKASAKNTKLKVLLVKLAQRIERIQGLTGRMKLGHDLPNDLKSALLSVFPNSAIETKVNDDVILRIDRIADSDVDERSWISALQHIRRSSVADEGDENKLTVAELRKIIGRGRLLYPDLSNCWQAADKNPKEYLRIIHSKDAEQAQEELFAIAKAVQLLSSDHDPIGLMDLSARFLKDSKALKTRSSLIKLLQDWLILVRYGDTDVEDIDDLRKSVLTDFGVFENVTSSKVTLFGPLKYVKQGKTFDWPVCLYKAGESATLSWDNLRDIERVILPENTVIITCENETPFNQLIRENHSGLIIYTAGYPNSAVQRLLRLFSISAVKIQHWGDSDLDGLIIASTLNKIIPLALWRCNIEELRRHQRRFLPLTTFQKSRAETYLANHSDFPFKEELQFTLQNGWLEQESWLPS